VQRSTTPLKKRMRFLSRRGARGATSGSKANWRTVRPAPIRLPIDFSPTAANIPPSFLGRQRSRSSDDKPSQLSTGISCEFGNQRIDSSRDEASSDSMLSGSVEHDGGAVSGTRLDSEQYSVSVRWHASVVKLAVLPTIRKKHHRNGVDFRAAEFLEAQLVTRSGTRSSG
jgi:hypothetical protein